MIESSINQSRCGCPLGIPSTVFLRYSFTRRRIGTRESFLSSITAVPIAVPLLRASVLQAGADAHALSPTPSVSLPSGEPVLRGSRAGESAQSGHSRAQSGHSLLSLRTGSGHCWGSKYKLAQRGGGGMGREQGWIARAARTTEARARSALNKRPIASVATLYLHRYWRRASPALGGARHLRAVPHRLPPRRCCSQSCRPHL